MANELEIELSVNGEHVKQSVLVRTNLADFLRDQLGLTGTHVGCEQGVCGACTVEVNGVSVRSCLMLAVQANGSDITTIEGIAAKSTGRKLQAAFVKHNALQCGYCTPGMLASATEYIERGGSADRDAIRQCLSGNYCRCTGYQAIVDAVASVIEIEPVQHDNSDEALA